MQLQFSIFFEFFFAYAVTVSNYLFMQLQFFLPELILHKYSVEGYAVLTVVFEVKPLFFMVTRRLWRSFQTFCNYMLQISAARKAKSSKIECYIKFNGSGWSGYKRIVLGRAGALVSFSSCTCVHRTENSNTHITARKNWSHTDCGSQKSRAHPSPHGHCPVDTARSCGAVWLVVFVVILQALFSTGGVTTDVRGVTQRCFFDLRRDCSSGSRGRRR